MPTITVSYKDLQELIGKQIRIKELENLLHNYCKMELDEYNQKTDEITLSASDTNMPFLWSAEGIARRLRVVLGICEDKHTCEWEVKLGKKSEYRVEVNTSVKNIRPYISCFVAKIKKGKITEQLLKQLIQLQEKICEGYGRKREKISIGIYPCTKIKFPVHYKAVEPESIKFIPLDFAQEASLKEILETHPKGKEYSHILKNAEKYPLLIDSEDNVLSFPPIINSERTGRVTEEDSMLFFDATGTEEEALRLATNIFAYALHDRDFEIIPVTISYGNKKIITPDITTEQIRINKENIKKWIGIKLSDKEIESLLKKAGYKTKKRATGYILEILQYRGDIMHEVDVIEDIAMMYGYENIKPLQLTTMTRGRALPITPLINKLRELVIGLGYQETMNLMLTNKNELYEKMYIEDTGTIEIQNPMSETHSAVRTWLIPGLMNILEKNKHESYPQKIFEQGLVTIRKGEEIKDYERIAIISCHKNADFTEIKQALDYLLRTLGCEHHIIETEHGTFIPGRIGRVIIKDKTGKETKIGYIGEIHPAVLEKHDLEIPVMAMELNITELFDALKM